MFSNRAVARPIGVWLIIIPREMAKLSDQSSVRGLNTLTRSPV